MRRLTKILAAIIGVGAIAAQSPQVQSLVAHFGSKHPNLSALLAGAAGLYALFHQPKAQGG